MLVKLRPNYYAKLPKFVLLQTYRGRSFEYFNLACYYTREGSKEKARYWLAMSKWMREKGLER